MKYTPEQLQYQANRFFEIPDKTREKPVGSRSGVKTLNALRIWLGITSDDWKRYCGIPEYSQVVDEIRTKLEVWLEERLLLDNKPVGAIFALKSQYGWTDNPTHQGNVNNYVYVFGNEKDNLLAQGKQLLIPKINNKAENGEKIVEMKPVPKRGRPKGSKAKEIFKRIRKSK